MQTQSEKPKQSFPFDYPSTAICVVRERGPSLEGKWVCLQIEFEPGTLFVKGWKVLTKSYHRREAEEEAGVEVQRRDVEVEAKREKCDWPIGETVKADANGKPVGTVAVSCGKVAIAKNKKEISTKVVQGNPFIQPNHKLCNNHRELLEEIYKLECVPL